MRNKLQFTVSLLVLTGMWVAACATPGPVVPEQPTGVIPTMPVESTETDQPTEIVPTVAVPTDTPGRLVTVTPEPPMETNPETFTFATWGKVDSLDPALNYERLGDSVLADIYDTLVTYEGADPNKIIPKLATGWEISEDGSTYVFTIRQGVQFHGGQDLTAEDVAYSFQRGLLQGHSWSPQWLFTEAFFGAGVYDVACLVDDNQCDLMDDPQALQAADPDTLLEVCQRVTEAVVADEQAGTVTFNLAQAWAPLLPTLTGSWGSIIDKDWAIENGAWDGDCTIWQDYYGVTSENAPLRAITNGTGPYKLDHWTPGEEVVLVANENYWLTEPLWQDGISGPPSLKRVVIQVVGEFGPRFAMLQDGKADLARVAYEDRPQVDPLVGEVCTFLDWGIYDCQPSQNPDQPLRLYRGTPNTHRADLYFNFNVNAEGGNPYLGSGKLDGEGIPPDFFSDIHVRKAFNYCFDWETYIVEAWGGNAVQNYGPIQVGLIGYDENAPHYSYDPEKCRSEIELAWDGALAENGFRMQFAHRSNSPGDQIIANILQTNFAAIDPKYQIEIVSMPSLNYWTESDGSRLPVFMVGWYEDIHDPHNWLYILNIFILQSLPAELADEIQALIDAGVAGQTVEERAEIYREIQRLDYENALALRTVVGSNDQYVQRWVSDYLINPMLREPFYMWAKH